MYLRLSVLALSLLAIPLAGAQESTWRSKRWKTPHRIPTLTVANHGRWLAHIRPTRKENAWTRIGWRPRLTPAIKEARALGRPILLWMMNGDPLGCV